MDQTTCKSEDVSVAETFFSMLIYWFEDYYVSLFQNYGSSTLATRLKLNQTWQTQSVSQKTDHYLEQNLPKKWYFLVVGEIKE